VTFLASRSPLQTQSRAIWRHTPGGRGMLTTMPRPPDHLDAAALRQAILTVPGRLGVWRAGTQALYQLLYRASLERLLDLARAQHEESRMGFVEATQVWRHATATLVEWSAALAGHASREPELQDVIAAVNRALDWRELETIATGLGSGDIFIESVVGWDVRLANSRDHAVEVLDLLLEQVTVPSPTDGAPSVEDVEGWFQDRAGRADLVQAIPSWVDDRMYERALFELSRRGTSADCRSRTPERAMRWLSHGPRLRPCARRFSIHPGQPSGAPLVAASWPTSRASVQRRQPMPSSGLPPTHRVDPLPQRH
jgi:hypothetical protein